MRAVAPSIIGEKIFANECRWMRGELRLAIHLYYFFPRAK